MSPRHRAAARRIALLAIVPIVLAAQTGWQADPAVVARTTAQQPGFNFDESRVGDYSLPDLLPADLRTRDGWPTRRAEILRLFRAHVYGTPLSTPDRVRFETLATDPAAMDGTATLKRVAVVSRQSGREHRFVLTIFLPNQPAGAPVGVFLLLNNRPASNTDPTRAEKSGFWPAEEIVARGYGIAAFQVGEVAPDDADRFREGAIALMEGTAPGARPADAPGALAAWAWGASRAMDYFVTDARMDAGRVAVVGHSRGGKAALWAGAEDERFSLVVSNDSGEGGAALARRDLGETLARITASFPHWFAPDYRTFAGHPEALPVDQHMLLALMAPRALYVASADEDLWADPRGEFLALAAASPAFALFGDAPIAPADMPPLDTPLAVGRRGYHIRRGGHDLTPYDWDRFVDFAASAWRR